MKRSANGQPAPLMLRQEPSDSGSRRDGIGRDGPSEPAGLALGGGPPAHEATNYRGFALVLLFSLLAFAWLALIRNVRVGFPGNPNAPRREAGVTTPADGATQAPGRSARGRGPRAAATLHGRGQSTPTPRLSERPDTGPMFGGAR
jgi:hypothetical protein